LAELRKDVRVVDATGEMETTHQRILQLISEVSL
jgi:nucleoside-triphosphatase THEP1